VAAGRHHLTILFSDLCDSTRISSSLEAEDYDALLDALRAILFEAAGRHGGEVARIDGDGAVVIFGYPDVHEDDGRRAVEAAIDMHATARRLAPDIPGAALGVRLHSGVHAGLVLVKDGDLVRGRFEMRGDATNIAARLADLAGADEILVSAVALGADVHFFEASETRSAFLRGREAPLAVHRIFGRRALANRFATRAARGLGPFRGRREALDRLDARLREATGGGNCLSVIVGAPGLGKTRLANELLAQAEAAGLSVHRGYCEAYLGARPLQPFLQILDQITCHTPAMLPATQEIALEDPAARFRSLLESLTLLEPVVMFLDDWQWADDASRRVLDGLREVKGRGLYILVASRAFSGIDAHLSGADVIDLEPLSAKEGEAAAAALLPAAEPFQVERIAAASGGNPLLLEELCHTRRLEQGGVGESPGGAWLDMLIESRFARLAPERAALVKMAAVIGPIVPAWLFEEITGTAATAEVMAALAADDFIYQDATPGVMRFKHAITRDAIYALIGLNERRATHAKVAIALRRRALSNAEPEPLEAMAYHLAASGESESAAAYAERAGDAAIDASALDRAQAQYRASLTALERLPPSTSLDEIWARVAHKFARASLFDPAREQLPILERARDRAAACGAARELAVAEYWLGVINYGLGECRQAIAHCERALTTAALCGDEKLTVEIQATLGRAHATACNYGSATRLLDQAIDLKRRRASTRLDTGLIYTMSCRAFLKADQGHFEQADAEFDAAMGAVGGALHQVTASILTQRSGACLWRGHMDAARVFAEEAERVAGRVKARYLFGMARALGAYARWSQDRRADALGALVEATGWLEQSDSQQRISLNHGWLTEALIATGDIARARYHARLTLVRSRLGDRLGEAMACRALARLAARAGDSRRADRWLRRAIAASQARRSSHEAAKNALCAAEIGGGEVDIQLAGANLAAMDLAFFAKASRRATTSGA
jgi:class 3 adenylate cyclase/tetratricopeptide (TPR) repeat protein